MVYAHGEKGRVRRGEQCSRSLDCTKKTLFFPKNGGWVGCALSSFILDFWNLFR